MLPKILSPALICLSLLYTTSEPRVTYQLAMDQASNAPALELPYCSTGWMMSKGVEGCGFGGTLKGMPTVTATRWPDTHTCAHTQPHTHPHTHTHPTTTTTTTY